MRAKLFGSVAAVALLGAVSGPAQAFDSNWYWDFDNYQDVKNDTWVWANFYPSGMTAVEKMQIFVGDVTAYAKLRGDYVAPTDATVTGGTIDFTVTWSGTTDDGPDPSVFGTGVEGAGNAVLGGDLSGEGALSGTLDEGDDAMELTAEFNDIDVEGLEVTFDFEPIDANLGLGHAVQDVSAVGIADSIESNVPVYAEETQILIGANEFGSDDLPWNEHHHHGHHGNQDGGNWLTDAVEILVDLIDQSEIKAIAEAGSRWDPVEIAIDQNASAVGEMVSIELVADPAYVIASANEDDGEYTWPDSSVDTRDTLFLGGHHHGVDYGDFATYYPINTNAILEADITQFAYANVTASTVAYQDLTAFTNLGVYDGLGTAGLVANQKVTAAGLVANISNTFAVPDVVEP